ncbi:MAG: homoserine kinase type [Methylobacteriaceae bacterium]|jgi:homoserine kinase type II|nr:homoserine kinase type [Methylobacteriaceae bacterium]
MAVYTEVSDEELVAFLATYDLGHVLSFKGIAEGVENSNYLLHTQSGNYILTLYEKRVHERDLPFFLRLMLHLCERGITCPQPVKARSGEMLGRLADRPAVIVTFLEGMSPRRPDAAQCTQVGEMAAKLHYAGADFPLRRPNALSLDGWRPLYDAAASRADQVVPGLRAILEKEVNFQERHFPGGLPSGVIHADLFPDNVFFLDGVCSGIIDFYFACNDAFAYEVAICLNAWCFEADASFNMTKGMALLAGYERVRPLEPRERDALPILARGSALRFLLTRLVDWLNVPPGALVKPKDPIEYLRKLRFHQKVASAREFGLAA